MTLYLLAGLGSRFCNTLCDNSIGSKGGSQLAHFLGRFASCCEAVLGVIASHVPMDPGTYLCQKA